MAHHPLPKCSLLAGLFKISQSESSLAVSQLATWKPHWIGGWSNFPSPSFGHGIQCFHLIFKIDHLTKHWTWNKCETTSQIQPVTFVAPVCKQQKASHVITRRNCEHSTWCLLLAIARNTTMMNSERSQFMAFWVPVDLCQAQRLMTFPSLTWNCSNPPRLKKTRKDLPSGYLT